MVANAANAQMLPDIILLDINMPVMDGWDFLDAYSPLHSQVAKKIRIYILSSSISESDMDKANRNPLVSRFVSKPIPESLLEEFLNAVKTEPHTSTV
jgi:CheY-like chemotaxis protein